MIVLSLYFKNIKIGFILTIYYLYRCYIVTFQIMDTFTLYFISLVMHFLKRLYKDTLQAVQIYSFDCVN